MNESQSPQVTETPYGWVNGDWFTRSSREGDPSFVPVYANPSERASTGRQPEALTDEQWRAARAVVDESDKGRTYVPADIGDYLVLVPRQFIEALRRALASTGWVHKSEEPQPYTQDSLDPKSFDATEAPALTDADLFDDIIAKIKFEPLSRAEQYAQLRRALASTEAPAETGWISVDERIPEDTVRVLAWAEPQNGIAYRWQGVWASATLMKDPTHWMPLPEAPVGRDSEGPREEPQSTAESPQIGNRGTAPTGEDVSIEYDSWTAHDL